MNRHDNSPDVHPAGSDRPTQRTASDLDVTEQDGVVNASLQGPGDPARAAFYWHLNEDVRARLRAEGGLLEDEGYLAHDILWGRRLLDVRQPYVSVPDVDQAWVVPEDSERFSDAIAAILHVAVEAGRDPEALCVEALETRERVESYAVWAAARRRERQTEPMAD